MPPEVCPNCGAEVPPDAKACPECGSDEQTGWSEAAAASSLGLPEAGDFDYDDFKKREFGGEKAVPRGISWYWWVVGIVVLAALLGLFLWR
jgi:RNA polymerase subunit RPABC4/transcription elongation factor Spt4